MTLRDHPSLWTFACSLYAIDDVKVRCLELQDQYSANVDIILWLCWLNVCKIRVDVSALADAVTIVGGINHEFLDGLRSFRKRLKTLELDDDSIKVIRSNLIDAELEIEKVLLHRLQSFTAQLTPVPSGPICLTLLRYLLVLSVTDANTYAEILNASTDDWALKNAEHGFAFHQS